MNTLIFLLATGVGNPPATPLHCPAAAAAKGDVKGGPPLVHTFELTHRGTGTLTITKVEAGCGCLRQSLTSGVLAPGETAKLALEVNTLTQPDGPNRWQIAVGYKVEAPGTPAQVGELLLQITATLSREVTVSPPQLGFSTAGTAKQVVSVTDSRGKPLTVLKATTTSPHLQADVGARAAGKVQEVTVTLLPDAPIGHRDEAVVLATDDPALSRAARPRSRAQARGRGCARRSRIHFAALRAGQTELSTLVQLRSVDGKPIEVAAAESDLPGVTIKHSPGAGAVAVVRVTVGESAASQSGSCKVRVKVSQPAAQEIVIPVAWTRAIK